MKIEESYRSLVLELLFKNQSAVLSLLRTLEVVNPKEKIKALLNDDEFEILEAENGEILKIKNKINGEVIKKGDEIYSLIWEKWVGKVWFDSNGLMGSSFGDIFYKNYINTPSGLYRLSEVSISERKELKEPAKEVLPKEIVVDGITYIQKKY